MHLKDRPKDSIEVPRAVLEKLMSLHNGKISEEVANIIGMSPREFESFKKEQKFQECISSEAKFHMFDKEFLSSENTSHYHMLKTLVSIGVNQEEIHIEDNSKGNKSYSNFATNYKSWLGEKLHMTKEEISQISIDDLDNRVGKYLSLAIEHVNKYIDMIPYELQDQFKSEYFGSIHETGTGQRTIHDLLIYYTRLEKEKQTAIKKGMLDADIIRNNTIAQFEIQRLLALAVLYRDREQNHEFQHIKEDESFIKSKLIEIFADKGKPRGSPAIKGLQSQSGLYDYTTTKTYYVSKKSDGDGYSVSEEKPSTGNYIKMNLDGTQIEGYTDYYKKAPSKVDIKHIMLRTAKDASSTIDKFIMKDYSSFTEILDQKGLIIVLDSFDNSNTLEHILINELGSKETSSVEKIEFVGGRHNPNSSESYSVKKGILKFSYKAKDRKSKMKSLKEDIYRLENEMGKLKRTCKSENMDVIKGMMEVVEGIKKDIEYLKNRLKNLSYNIEVEVQIFDVNSYIKAEIDKDSPAYHGAYKKYQKMFDIFPKYFPKHVYGEENLRQVLMPVINEKFNKELTI